MENNQMYYTYFKPEVRAEHMLFAKEIAEKFNIQSRSGKIAYSFVNAYLKEIAKKMNQEQLYYCTKHGMARVYPASFYNKAIKNLIYILGYNTEHKVTVNDKNYYIKVVK